MFCNKCGSKLTENAKTCNNCGAPSDHAEYCGGFWGLVGEEKAPVVPITVAENPTKKRVNNGASSSSSALVPSDQKRKKPIIWYVVCSILLLMLLIQTCGAFYFSVRYESTQEKYCELNEVYLEIKTQNDLLIETINSLVNDMSLIGDDIADIKDIIMPTESGSTEDESTLDDIKNETDPASGEDTESTDNYSLGTAEDRTDKTTTESTESEVSHG